MKNLVAISLVMFQAGIICAQTPNWQNKDLKSDSIFGISTEKAYAELLHNKKSKTVIVAVIDGGIDTAHEDLKAVLWRKNKEKINGKDDDNNGYIDDRCGWNFIGGSNGNVKYDNIELLRIIRRDKNFYDSLSCTLVPEEFRSGYQAYKKMKNIYYWELEVAMKENKENYNQLTMLAEMEIAFNKSILASKDFQNYQVRNEDEMNLRKAMIEQLNAGRDYKSLKNQLNTYCNHFREQIDYHLNINYDSRSIVGDSYNNSKERLYGNNDITGPDATHGTHVAGIIGAVRNNNIGIDGIADNVQIMCIRIVPNGDERDKDVANAIYYAVDNGAQIINMSFGKNYSWDKKIVDDAVFYAMKNDVLIIHASGNDGLDMDINDVFPNKRYSEGSGEANAWIEVGASGYNNSGMIVPGFSNYGRTTVDVFAPGLHIYSTIPGSQYEYKDGTSMAAPVVSGLAALIREYYPKLTSVQVKNIIMQSVIKKAALKNKCVSGGVINAYNALKLAALVNKK
jgi:subtilisin family serine protease